MSNIKIKFTKEEQVLHYLLSNAGKWVHLPQTKRKNRFHIKSDSKARKDLFESVCRSLSLMGIAYRTQPSYFIYVES